MLAGVVAGVAAALALVRLIRCLAFGVSETDPWIFIGAALILAIVAGIACRVAAHRASRVDPATALRLE